MPSREARWAQAHEVLAFVRERGVVHPREVDRQFQHGKSRNWFGGSGNASTQLLDGMHYRGLLRVARRESGTCCYAAREAIVAKYAPLPVPSMSQLTMFMAAWLDRARGPTAP